MSSYLKKPPKNNGARGGDAFKTCFEEGIARVLTVITNIENLGDDSTIAALRARMDAGETTIEIEEVNTMLQKIRMDLLDAQFYLAQARERVSA